MDLRSDFAGPKLSGHLLVEHSRNHQLHYIALSCGQSLIAPKQIGHLALLLASRTVAFERLLDCIQQILIAEWFGQKLHRARFHCLDRHRDVAVPGDEDDWNLYTRVGQLALEVDAAKPGKPHVENEATGAVRTLPGQELLRTRKRLRRQSDRFHQSLD